MSQKKNPLVQKKNNSYFVTIQRIKKNNFLGFFYGILERLFGTPDRYGNSILVNQRTSGQYYCYRWQGTFHFHPHCYFSQSTRVPFHFHFYIGNRYDLIYLVHIAFHPDNLKCDLICLEPLLYFLSFSQTSSYQNR